MIHIFTPETQKTKFNTLVRKAGTNAQLLGFLPSPAHRAPVKLVKGAIKTVQLRAFKLIFNAAAARYKTDRPIMANNKKPIKIVAAGLLALINFTAWFV
jgi:ribosomal protein L2